MRFSSKYENFVVLTPTLFYTANILAIIDFSHFSTYLKSKKNAKL